MRTEDDIRAAFRAVARQAPDADAVLTAVREQLDNASAGPREKGRRPARRLMTPLAAAAAVVAVTVAAVAIANGQPAHHPGATSAATSGARSGSGLDRLPRYYLSLALTPSGSRATYSAVVKDTVTGATLATINPPKPFGTFAGVAGAADDRTFVLAARKFTAEPGAEAPIKLYRAVYDPARATVTLTALPIPEIPAADTLNGFALSPSGASLAVGITTNQVRNGRQQVRIYSLPSGTVKVWQQPPTAGPGFQPSFAQSGVLAFNWAGAPAQGTWLLRTGTSGGNLTSNSQLAVPAEVGRYSVAGGVLSGDGSIITAVKTTALPSKHTGNKIVLVQFLSKIVQFAVQGGRAIRTLWTSRHIGGIGSDASVIWSSSSGDVVVAQAQTSSGPVIGVLHGGRLTPIPGVPEGISYHDPLFGEGSVLAF